MTSKAIIAFSFFLCFVSFSLAVMGGKKDDRTSYDYSYELICCRTSGDSFKNTWGGHSWHIYWYIMDTVTRVLAMGRISRNIHLEKGCQTITFFLFSLVVSFSMYRLEGGKINGKYGTINTICNWSAYMRNIMVFYGTSWSRINRINSNSILRPKQFK